MNYKTINYSYIGRLLDVFVILNFNSKIKINMKMTDAFDDVTRTHTTHITRHAYHITYR